MNRELKEHPLHYSIYTRSCARDIFDMLAMSNGKLLDAGCGIGYYIEKILTEYNEIKIFGLEYDIDSVIFAANRIKGSFSNGDATFMPYKNDSFDKVLSVSVLEHIEDDEKVVREMIRVCRNKGEIIISVPSKDGIRSYSRLRNLGHEDPSSPEYHFRIGYSKLELISLLEKYGVKIEECRYSMILSTELIMDFVKWIYLKKNKLDNQTNIYDATDSMLFSIYKIFFPLILLAEYVEKVLLGRWLKGHILCVRGIVKKDL